MDGELVIVGVKRVTVGSLEITSVRRNSSRAASAEKDVFEDPASRPKAVIELEKKHRAQQESLSLFQSPASTLSHFAAFCFDKLQQVVTHYIIHFAQLSIISLVVAGVWTLVSSEGSHAPIVDRIESLVLWYGGWILLGIASSAGIGSGLHTFLLYLGPFIAQAVMKAHACGDSALAVSATSTVFDVTMLCDESSGPSASPLLDLFKWECLCWGIGTAIGEIPPFLLGRAAASVSGKAEDNSVLASLVAQQQSGKALSLVVRVKLTCLHLMRKFGFLGVLFMASFPNPLFDLAGILAGLLKLPFSVFFGATLVGKALVKAPLQALFVAALFSKGSLDFMMSKIEEICQLEVVTRHFPTVFSDVTEILATLKAGYESPETHASSFLEKAYNGFFYLVVVFFVVNIVHSIAQLHLSKIQRREMAKFKESLRSRQ